MKQYLNPFKRGQTNDQFFIELIELRIFETI